LKQASFSQVSDKISAYNKIVKSQGNLFGHISNRILHAIYLLKPKFSLVKSQNRVSSYRKVVKT
ncbi:hypothetical protein, partial [Klebsiella pneumoniae]|uniref:hypothetical protein n=1 Tax=Klebsiella pneumoniae TaxID=573 RepID=UPI001BB17284